MNRAYKTETGKTIKWVLFAGEIIIDENRVLNNDLYFY